jgi:site-specific DNA-adenine methylase
MRTRHEQAEARRIGRRGGLITAQRDPIEEMAVLCNLQRVTMSELFALYMEVEERLRTVEILHRPAIDVIQKWDSVDTVSYLDPPYVSESRTSKKVYDCEMTTADHSELAMTLRACVGKVILSGYPSDLYAELYCDWRTHDIDVDNHAAGGSSKARMTERLWFNWKDE